MFTFEAIANKKSPVAVVGLGYVGLPLAVALARHFRVLGFNRSEKRVAELEKGFDRTGEISPECLKSSGIKFSSSPEILGEAGVIIVAVPTPIDAHRTPDLAPLKEASLTVGRHMPKGAVVVYESTVYPGVTEDICVPILEEASGFKFKRDFTVGYSPERINPGDKVHTVDKIIKIVSGSDDPTLELLSRLYGKVTEAGVHRAPSIKVAEAAKVIENTQRDLNIALMNELSLVFDRLGIDTLDVLEAAGTKWNFLPFRPGLVGGHCIGVDPYYLTYKAEEAGYHPEVILAGRRINDGMGKYVAERAVKMLIANGQMVKDAKIGIFGLTFKENVPDLRNSKVADICAELHEFGTKIFVHDPLADTFEAEKEYGLKLQNLEDMKGLNAIIFAVPHAVYDKIDLAALKSRFAAPEKAILLDVKGRWKPEEAAAMGINYWRL